jgi:NADH-quinone oxidoreductase subunit L
MTIVAIVGVLTALMAATIGLVQNDIKRVLAYSTVSQLGYMFTAMGVGAFSAGAFHLMTHAFFKALLFLGSGSVIHAMAGEQDMRKMGGLKKHLPVTFATMMIGTLAIAGIFPLSGFFSKDEILFRAFVSNKAIWVLAVATAFMTAFYMFRLMSMTFFGGYRGRKWEMASHTAVATAMTHDAVHPADAFAHGQAQKPAHEVTHGPADTLGHARGHDDDYGHGPGPWHGPHESPTPMTFPLMALAVGAIVAGFVGIPAAIGGGNAIEKFLEPSFTAQSVQLKLDATEGNASVRLQPGVASGAEQTEHEESSVSPNVERGLMGFSLAIAVIGILLARKFYVTSPEISDRLADQFAGPHRVLSNKYYVDEAYNATVISGTFTAGKGLWAFDRTVVDGVVNGSGWFTIVSAWFSGVADRRLVDGAVNLVGRICEEGSFWFRKLQTGLVQNYAMWMLVGIFAFVSIYLFMR